MYDRVINERDKRMIINNVNTLYDEITDEKEEKSWQSIKLMLHIMKSLMKCDRR